MIVRIKFNNLKLGKRYVKCKYYAWELWQTEPYRYLSNIKLRWFILREIQWHTEN